MTGNSDLARMYGSDFDAVYLAPLGTVLPTTINGDLDEAFEDVGWLSTDGLTESLSGSVDKKRGHQGQRVIRTRMNETGTSWAFVALETKAQTQSLRYVEKAVTTTAGVRQAVRSAGQNIKVRAAVIDFFDADEVTVAERIVIPRFEISPNGDKTIANDLVAYPFLGEIIGDYTSFLTDGEAA